MTNKQDCLFCSIAEGETDAAIVWSDDDFAAFLDFRPVFKGHVLLVPRQHVVTLPDLPAPLRDPFLAATQRLASAMVAGLDAQGSFVAVNNTVPSRCRTCTATWSLAPRVTGCVASSGRGRSTPMPVSGTRGGPCCSRTRVTAARTAHRREDRPDGSIRRTRRDRHRAARGIGAGTAKRFAQEGASVAVLDLDEGQDRHREGARWLGQGRRPRLQRR